jgi:hypothetical protein
MSSFPCLVRFVSGSGQVRYRLGERLVDRYLEFVAGRCRPNTLRAVAFDLKAFFVVTGKDPVEVTAADVFDFLADQRGGRAVIRLADRESGLSARTIARRLSSVSGPVCVPDRPGRHAGAGEPGAAGSADAAAGWVGAVADRAAGAGAAHAAADLVAGRGGPAGRRVAHRPGPGDGTCDAAGRAAPVRGAGPAVLRRAGRRPAAGHRGGQGRASPGGPGCEPVLRRARLLSAR